MVEDGPTFGFIILDGKGALFATLSGTTKTILAKYSVTLPNKHARGGQSALRFSRLRDIARHNYIQKGAEKAKECFLKDNAVTVEGIIIAGSAELKTELSSSNLLDPRLQRKVLKVVDCEYGGESGLNQAIESSSNVLGSVKMVKEKQILNDYFEQLHKDTGKVASGIADTLTSLEMGAAETIVVYEDLEMTIVGSEIFQKGNKVHESTFPFGQMEEEEMLLTDWLAENHHKFGVQLLFVSNSSPEGNQFPRAWEELDHSCDGRWISPCLKSLKTRMWRRSKIKSPQRHFLNLVCHPRRPSMIVLRSQPLRSDLVQRM